MVDFVWDEVKRETNIRKHGIDFADAVSALEDIGNRTKEDVDAAGEARFVTLGLDALARVLVVVWSQPDENVIRVISARRASSGERKQYEV